MGRGFTIVACTKHGARWRQKTPSVDTRLNLRGGRGGADIVLNVVVVLCCCDVVVLWLC